MEQDTLREMCIQQGYVPPKCALPGPMVWGLMQKGEDPCAGCNVPRSECGGRAKIKD